VEWAARSGRAEDGVGCELGRARHEIAAEFGPMRESFSRALSRLLREGIIAQTGSRISVRFNDRSEVVACPD